MEGEYDYSNTESKQAEQLCRELETYNNRPHSRPNFLLHSRQKDKEGCNVQPKAERVHV